MLKYFAIIIVAVFMNGCDKYDWKPDDDRLIGGSIAPVINITSDLTLDGATDYSIAQQLPITVTHPNKPSSALTVTWQEDSGNPAPVSIVENNGTYEARFARNGVYQINVTASDGANESQDTLLITVTAVDMVKINGSVSDNLSLIEDISVDLMFSDGTLIESVVTDSSGAFSFDDLIGGEENYQVVVQ